MPGPRWHGSEPVQGRTLLLLSEQGLGDTLQACRYVPLLRARGARVVLQVQPPLLPLLHDLAADTLAVPGDKLPPFDAWCPLMSLPRAFATTPQTVPAAPYLAASPQRLRIWRGRLGPRRGLRVGLAWAGNPDHPLDALRSLPQAALAPLLDIPGIEAHALQPEARPDDGRIRPHPEIADFADAAALATLMDVVVTVDTATAHLAGALGRQVWILLAHAPDFRWMLDRTDTPWYPSARLFRQTRPRDWSGVIDAAARALDAFGSRRAAFRTGPTMTQTRVTYARLVRLREELAARPGSAAALGALGSALWQAGQREEGLLRLQQAVQADPDHPESLISLGNALAALRRPEAAERLYRSVLAMRPDDAVMHFNIGCAWLAADDAARAEAAFRAALGLRPDYAAALNNLGSTLRRQDRPAEALEYYRRAAALRPDLPGVHGNVGSALLALGRADEALAHLRTASRLDPDNAEACNNLGGALLALDQAPEAAGWFRLGGQARPEPLPGPLRPRACTAGPGRVPRRLGGVRGALARPRLHRRRARVRAPRLARRCAPCRAARCCCTPNRDWVTRCNSSATCPCCGPAVHVSCCRSSRR